MFYFDTHIHLQDFDDEVIVEKLQNAQITKCICISAHEADWEKVALLYEKYPNIIIPAFGLHPWYSNEKTAHWYQKLELFLQKYPQSLIGECGFDSLKNVSYNIQREVFLDQINLANKYKKSMIIHAVKADNWLNEVWDKLPKKFVFHSFNSRVNLLKKIMSYGGYVAFNKKILNNKQSKEIILSVNIDKILVETDAPYQSNIADLSALIKNLAQIRNEKLEYFANHSYSNAEEFVNYEK